MPAAAETRSRLHSLLERFRREKGGASAQRQAIVEERFSDRNGDRNIDLSGNRLRIAVVGFLVVYGIITGRLVLLGMAEVQPSLALQSARDSVAAARPNLIDRNGVILATDIKTSSLYAEPYKINYIDDAIEKLSAVLPELGTMATRRKLESKARFVWLKRELTPQQQQAIHELGIPGVGFIPENRRFYPGGSTAGHIVGTVNIDNQGIGGLEKYIDGQGLAVLQKMGMSADSDMRPVKLSVDLRVQHAIRDELKRAMERYKAIAAVGIVLNVKTGEVMGMSSLPDFNPNDPKQALEKNRLNRATAGVFEMGSVFKTFTTAMALDSGLVKMSDSFDARNPIRIGGFTISDFHAKRRILKVPEIFIFSSNIGTAKMARTVGIDGQREFLKRLGLTTRMHTELPEVARPLRPRKWTELTSMTVSFGHGISVTPMQTAVAAAALMNGGRLISPTFFPRTEKEAMSHAKQVVKPETSLAMRELFRLNALKGSGRKAEVPGYVVGGKTGTAEKVVNGRYDRSKRRNSFLAAFPMTDPKYVVLVVLDEPKPEKKGMYATAGWNAAPTVAGIIRRSAPMLGISPEFDAKSTVLVSN